MEETGFLIGKYLFTDLDNSPSHNEKSEIIIWSRKQIKKYVFFYSEFTRCWFIEGV